MKMSWIHIWKPKAVMELLGKPNRKLVKLAGYVLHSLLLTRLILVLTDILHHGVILAFLQVCHHVVSSSA